MLGVLAACAPDKPALREGALRVVASFYPLVEAAQRVGGSHVEVTNLTPAGVEPHDVEMTPRDADMIGDADVVVYLGGKFQPAIARTAEDNPGAVDLGHAIARGSDPHFWLDPTLMQAAVKRVRAGLAKADPKHAAIYARNASAFEAKLDALDTKMGVGLAHCARREIVTAHAAFGYLASHYTLTQYSISGLSPDAEPSPSRIAKLAALVREKRVTTVFFEELTPRDFADTLAKDAGVTTAALNPLEGLTKAELERGDNYVSVMTRNYEALRVALGCTDAPQS